MSDMDRFVQFLIRAGADYHAPPEAPREAMWSAIERELEDGVVAADGDPLLAAAVAYHEPPTAPTEDMWGRIEAAWALRSEAPAGAREAGLDALPAWRPAADRPDAGRRWTRWATGIAVAAALVIGIALGRTTLSGPATGGRSVAMGDDTAGAGDAPAPAALASDEDGGSGGSMRDVDGGAAEPLESGVRLAAEAPLRSVPSDARPDAAGRRPGTTPRSTARDAALRYATAEHLGRTETLLTAFKTGLDDGSTAELADWAHELLGETRLLLDTSPESRSTRERALLEELELVLAQIAGLSADGPDFERDLIAKGIERRGTIARVRAASPGAGQVAGT